MDAMTTTAAPAIGGSFFKNTMTLVGGNIVARIITFGLAPVITRLYAPQVFGAFAILVSLAELFIAVSSLRYNNAILLPEEKQDADSLVALCLVLVLGTSFVSLTAVVGFQSPIAALLNFENQKLLLFVPAIVLIGGLQQVTDMWFLRLKNFNRLAVSKISGATADRISTIGAAFLLTNSPGGLVLGRIFGIVSSLAALFVAGLQPVKDLVKAASRERFRSLSRRYIAFPKFLEDAFVQRASVQAPLLLLGAFFSPGAAGMYALTQRILGEPMTLIGDSLGRSFSQKASEHFRKGENMAPDALRLYRYILSFIAAPMLILSFILADLFGIIFGAEWREAGDYVKLVLPVFVAVFAVRPMSVFYDLFEKQKERLFHNIISLGVICCSFAAGYAAGSPNLALILYAVSATLVILLRTGWLMALAGTAWQNFWRATLNGLLWPLCIVGSVLILQATPWSRYLIIYCLTATLLYLTAIIRNDKAMSKQFKDYYHAGISKFKNSL
jgi:O-antigen/teichoic acid export membrane protein